MANQPSKYSKFLVGAASAALVASAVAPVASAADFKDTKGNTHEKEINALVEAGVISGYPDGSFLPNKTLTRSDVVKMMGKLLVSLGNEVPTDYKTNPRFTDQTSKTNDELLKASALVKDHGVFNGLENGSLNAAGDITRENMAIVLVRAYDAINKTDLVAYVKEQEFKKDVTDLATAKAEAQPYIDVLDFFDITNPVAPQFNPKATTTRGQFASFLFKTTAVEAPGEKVTTATKVETVTATNLKEIVVAFDGTVDAATAENEENYTLTTGTVEFALVSADSKSVTLTVAGDGLRNQIANKLSVKGVKAGDVVISSEHAFTPVDATLPEVKEVTSLGTKALKVTFSEPIKTAAVGSFKLDGKAFYGSPTVGSHEVILTPYDASALVVGEHTLAIAGVEDYSGLKSLPSEHKFTVVEDKVAPTVTANEATLERLIVTFSEDIDPDTLSKDNVYFKSGDTKVKPVGITKIAGNKYAFDFTGNALPSYETTVWIEGVKDYSGNAMTETTIKVKASVDNTRPEVTQVSVNNAGTSFQVKFSKKVKVLSDYTNFINVTDKDGKVRSISSATLNADGKSLTVDLYAKLPQGKNTIKVAGIKDATTLENTMLDYTTDVTVGDTVAPKYSAHSVNFDVVRGIQRVIVTFNEKMDPATIANPSNYTMTFNGVERTLPSDATLTVIQDSKAILIDFPTKIDNITVNDASFTKLKVFGVKDAAGNVLDGFVKDLTIDSTVLPTVGDYSSDYTGYKAAVTGKKTIAMEFNQAIAKASKNDFKVYTGAGAELEISSITTNNTGKVVINLTNELASTAPELRVETVLNNAIETVAGKVGVAVVKLNESAGSYSANSQVLEFLSPEVNKPTTGVQSYTAAWVNATTSSIVVPFTEQLNKANGVDTYYANDLIVKRSSDLKVLQAGVDYTTAVTSGSGTDQDITVTIKSSVGGDSLYTVEVKNDAKYIQDVSPAENLVAARGPIVSSAKIDFVAPTLISAKLVEVAGIGVAGTAEIGETVELTFSETLAIPALLTELANDLVLSASDTFGTGATYAVSGNKVVVTIVATPTLTVGTSTINVTGAPEDITLTDLVGNKTVVLTTPVIIK